VPAAFHKFCVLREINMVESFDQSRLSTERLQKVVALFSKQVQNFVGDFACLLCYFLPFCSKICGYRSCWVL